MIPLKTASHVYEIVTRTNKKRLIVDAYDGSKIMMSHKNIEVVFKHKETGDKALFRITGNGICYQQPILGKELKIDQDECVSEFGRLLGNKDAGIIVFKTCQMRMA